jgi:hypothetical protein
VANGIPDKDHFPFDLKAVAGTILSSAIISQCLAEEILFSCRMSISVASKATNCEIK